MLSASPVKPCSTNTGRPRPSIDGHVDDRHTPRREGALERRRELGVALDAHALQAEECGCAGEIETVGSREEAIEIHRRTLPCDGQEREDSSTIVVEDDDGEIEEL